jgi:glyoxylase-like metal-dependent hydrolase (beta-lactamase superfamily II)
VNQCLIYYRSSQKRCGINPKAESWFKKGLLNKDTFLKMAVQSSIFVLKTISFPSKVKNIITKSGVSITKMLGGRSNVFLIKAGDMVLLVDTSPALFKKQLLNSIRNKNIHSIDYLILTHTHFDHAGNAAIIKEKYAAKVIVHRNEAEYLLTGNSPVPAGTNSFTKWLVKHPGALAAKYYTYKGCKADMLVSDVIEMPVKNAQIKIIHTPGHSAGSVSVIIDEEIALVGDTLFGTYPGSCFPPFADDVPQLIRSWGILLDTGCKYFYPAHGGVIHRSLLEEAFKNRSKIPSPSPSH